MTSPDLFPALDAANRAIVGACRLVGSTPSASTHRVDDATSALVALDTAERALSTLGPADGDSSEAVRAVTAARAELLAYQLGRQRSLMPLLTSSLTALRAATTVDDLVESVPIQATALGYERAMFSWVDHELWVPRSMHTLSGPAEAKAALAAGAPPYQKIRDVLEVEVVRQRRPILVLDAESNPRVHPRIIQVTHSRTYVAAPIVARNHVVAFVHLDRSAASGTTDEFDRDLLALFCESAGVMLDRLLAEQESATGTDLSMPSSDWLECLTAREREVLILLSGGLTNAQIAARLFVSEETTKTHVKKLMRKIGAPNRAKAAAMFHARRGRAAARTVAPTSA